jgi:hypothetical protein
MFLWTIFFSLLLKRVLMAAILGAAAASVGAFLIAASIAPRIVMEMYAAAVPRRAILAALLAMADFWLASRWFNERRLRSAGPAAGIITPTQATTFSDRFRVPGRMTILGRLLWQHWRQSRWLTMTIMGTILVPLLLIGIRWLLTGDPAYLSRPQNVDDSVFLAIEILLSMIGVSLLGLCAFHADQWRRSYRFLADRGVPPKYVWLSRQLMAFSPLVVLLLTLLPAVFLVASLLLPDPVLGGPPHWAGMTGECAGLIAIGCFILAAVGYVVLAVTVGQLASMFLRSGLLAGIISVILTCLLACWCALMWFWGIAWLWSVVPIPLVLLLATRLRTRDWLLERNSLRAWLWPALALIVPAVALLTAAPLYRIYSVPLIGAGFSLEPYDRPMTREEQTTLDLYMQAHFKVARLGLDRYNALRLARDAGHRPSIMAAEATWVRQNREVIDAALKAGERPFSVRVVAQLSQWQTSYLADLLICSASQLEEEGKLDAAMQRYLAAIKIAVQLHAWYPIQWPPYAFDLNRGNQIEIEIYARLPRWAARPGQTPERLLAAARQLEKLTAHIPTSDGIKAAHCCIRRFLLGDVRAINRTEVNYSQPVPALTLFWLRLPWERARALRVLDCVTRGQLDGLAVAQRAARRGEAIHQAPPPPQEGAVGWFREIDFPYTLQRQVLVPPICYPQPWAASELVRGYTAVETSRRATRLLLALEAWKLQHGALPKSLDELVGPCLDRLPVDPYAGKPFRYFRDGFKTPLSWNQPTLARLLDYGNERQLAEGGIGADKPFIWSIGAKIYREPSANEGSVVECRIYRDPDGRGDYGDPNLDFRWPTSKLDVWSSGWPFPIP